MIGIHMETSLIFHILFPFPMDATSNFMQSYKKISKSANNYAILFSQNAEKLLLPPKRTKN